MVVIVLRMVHLGHTCDDIDIRYALNKDDVIF